MQIQNNMRKIVIQDHINAEIYEYITSTAPHVPEYVKFAYVADRYPEIKSELANQESKKRLEIFNEKIPLPQNLAQYDEKYQNCQKVEGFMAYYKSQESKFTIPKERETKFYAIIYAPVIYNLINSDNSKKSYFARFLVDNPGYCAMQPIYKEIIAKKKSKEFSQEKETFINEISQKIDEEFLRQFLEDNQDFNESLNKLIFEQKCKAVSEAAPADVEAAKLDLTKFIILQPNFVTTGETVDTAIYGLYNKIINLPKDQQDEKLQEVSERLLADPTFGEWLMKFVHHVVKFCTAKKFKPFELEVKVTEARSSFIEYLAQKTPPGAGNKPAL